MFHFVSSHEVLTPELEASIADASAWAEVIPTGRIKPTGNVGALVQESFSQLKGDVDKLEHQLQAETKAREDANRAEAKTREEFDIVLAQQIANINNLLSEKGILEQQVGRIHDANSVLYNCIVCMDQQRTMRFNPCGHMATCVSCTEKIMNAQDRKCPLCRTIVTAAQRTFLS